MFKLQQLLCSWRDTKISHPLTATPFDKNVQFSLSVIVNVLPIIWPTLRSINWSRLEHWCILQDITIPGANRWRYNRSWIFHHRWVQAQTTIMHIRFRPHQIMYCWVTANWCLMAKLKNDLKLRRITTVTPSGRNLKASQFSVGHVSRLYKPSCEPIR